MTILKYFIICSLCFGFISCKTKKETAGGNKQTSASQNNENTIEGLNLGNIAPEIMMAAPNGNVVTLSSLKGKLVLIDFWASWCAPCRAENPYLVAVYKKYHTANFKKGKGFDILSVSLDQNEMAWQKAISKDSLTWPNHVCDLQGWNNAAARKYGISSIPNNVLVDANGIIIAKGLRGELLEKTLNSLLK